MAVNKYFTYEDIRVWEDGAWDDVISSVAPLCRWIEGKNKELGKFMVSPGGEDIAPKGYNFKRISDEERTYWESRGMSYYACGLGGISLIPADYRKDETEEPEVILRLVQNRKTSRTRIHDILTYHKELCEMAADERYAVYFAPTDGVDPTDNYTQVLQEIASLSHMRLNKIWLDVSTVYEAGQTLSEIPGFILRDKTGTVVKKPDNCVRKIGAIELPCLDISDIWYERSSQMYCMGHLLRWTNGSMDPDRLVHSSAGKRMAEFMTYEHDFEDARNPELKACWDKYGLDCEFHQHKYDQWISLVPKGAMEGGEKLPLVVVFQDIPQASVHTPLTAWSQYSGFLTIAGQGDCCLMFFVMEDKEDNEILSELLKEYAKMYPIDLSRVYIVGHSHNGGFASAYIRRHSKEIAAIGTLGNHAGFIPGCEMGPETMAVEDDEIEFMAKHMDVPTVNVIGCAEHMCQYPLYRAENEKELERRVRNWNRRLKAYNCRENTIEEITACANDKDYVVRTLGFPANWTECLYMDGAENYMADIENREGKRHLRQIAMGNLPHTVSPLMCDLVWSFLKRFAKDTETGECIELY